MRKLAILLLILASVTADGGCDHTYTLLHISNVVASDITSSSSTITWTSDQPVAVTWTPDEPVTITWTTDVPATSQVEYGRSTSYDWSSPLDDSLVMNHSVRLGDLKSDSIYHYRVRSRDADGNEAVSGDYTYGWCYMLVDVIAKGIPYNGLREFAGKIPQDYFKDVDADSLIGWIEQGFEHHPANEGRKRDSFFIALDVAMISSEEKDYSAMVQHRAKTTRMICQALEAWEATEDLTVYKLYNEGTIIRAPGVCLGVDIVVEPANNDLAPGLARTLDALFITHSDGDHYDYGSSLISELQKAGKPVILATDDSSVPIGGITASGTVGSIGWTSFRGAHCNMRFSGFFHFRVGEWSILHSGDNTRWMDFTESTYAKDLDLFLFKPESIYGSSPQYQDIQEALKETLDKMQPRLLVPQHMLEIGHGMDAYGYDMGIRLYDEAPLATKVQMLDWGEQLVVPRK